MNRNETKKLLRQLTAMPSPPIPPGLEGRLVAIGAGEASASTRREDRWRRTWRIAATVAACVTLAAAGVVISTNVWRDRNEPVATTQVAPTPSMIDHDHIVSSPSSSPSSPVMTARSTRMQETRLCDIFPPLPPPL
jgi:hypothetical protein